MKKANFQTIILLILGVLASLGLLYFLDVSERTLPNYATIIGTVCSIIGLLIAYVNIRALKKASDEMSDKIKSTLETVTRLDSVSVVSKALKINQEIQYLIRENKIELAHMRTTDLKYFLHQFDDNILLTELDNKVAFQRSIIAIGIDLNSMSDFILDSSKKIDLSKIIKNLESLSTHLTKFELKLKTVKYDT